MQHRFFVGRATAWLFTGVAMLVGIVAFTAIGCGPSTEKTPDQGQDAIVFFDLRDFFNQEVKSLQKDKPQARKTVRLDGRESVQTAAGINYTAELAPFIQSDINKPSWKDKYRVDSIFTGGSLEEIRYTAGDATLKTKELRVFFKGNGVHSVWIKNSIHSIISESDQELKYDKYKGYSIYGQQGGRFSKEKHFSVEVKF